MTVTATFHDGAFHPDQPLDLPDGTRVQIPIQPAEPVHAWMDIRLSADADLPADFSENLDAYLAGRTTHGGRRLDGRDGG